MTIPQSGLKSLYIIRGIATILQLVAILSYGVMTGELEPKPNTAQEYFTIHQTSRLASVVRRGLLLLILIGLYLGTFPALYVALRRARRSSLRICGAAPVGTCPAFSCKEQV